jgi:hypothetical protein
LKIFSVAEIKQELSDADAKQLLEICLRLIKFKKENKELVSYLLFESNDLSWYISEIKKDIDAEFAQVNRSNLYFAKKTIRKILKNTNRFIRYTQSKEAEAELLIYFCKTAKDSGLKIGNSPALLNLYNNQVKKIKAIVNSLHEDLQYDLNKEVALL